MTQAPKTNNNWKDLDRKYFLHPFTAHKELRAVGSHIITHAEGCYIHTDEGRKIFDGMSGLWCCNLGYDCDHIKQAIQTQLQELPYYNSFFQCTHPPAVELAQRLVRLAPDHIREVFFTNSGSEANDTNLRMVWRYWDMMGRPEKRVIISRDLAYHGSTIAAAGLGGMSGMHSQIVELPYMAHIMPPYHYAYGRDMTAEAFGLKAAQALEEKILEIGADKVAAFIGEPVMGAGGVIIPPDTYWPEIERICRKYDILLISDEVICGFGRMGEWFGADYYGIKPDLITFAKGVTNGFQPLGGVMVGARVAEALDRDDQEFTHGFTYSGHPAACAAALATLDMLEDGGVIERVRTETGPYFEQRLRELRDHPIVGEVRTLGLFCAIELVRDKATGARFEGHPAASMVCRAASLENGLVMRGVGDNLMIIAPPLTISREQTDEIFDKALKALNITAQKLT